MPKAMGTTMDMLLDVGLDTIVGALILAFLIALVTAGAYFLVRRGTTRCTTKRVTFVLTAKVACLVTGAGFIQSRSASARRDRAIVDRVSRNANEPRHRVRPATKWRRAGFSRGIAEDRLGNTKDAP